MNVNFTIHKFKKDHNFIQVFFLIFYCTGLKFSAKAQCVQSACFVAGDFCQYWNLIFQITDDFDILIMVSKAKFQKKLNGKNRFT